ncbi:MAG: hypothetical protein HYY17_11955 [Planctomycetes bacterium]|nr:hypothetical protein [Planctomycetota bacterium]
MNVRPLVAALILPAAWFGGCADKGKKEPSRSDAKPALVSVRYDAWAEDIHVDGDAMTIVHTKTEYTYARPMDSNPSGSEVHKILDGRVTKEDLEALGAFVRESGFLDLKDAYGAPEGHRYYPYNLEVTFRGEKPKKVQFRSNPEFESSPEPFKKLEKRLAELSEAVRKR